MDREPRDIGRNTPGVPRRASAAQRALGAFCCVVLTGIPCCPVAAAPDATSDSLLSLHGLTLYGTLDIGLQYQTHAAPTSAYFPGGSGDFVQKNDREAVFGVTPNNWGQSKIGLQGLEPLLGSWSAVFTLETFFNPQSGQISDGLKSLALNNGRPLAAQTTNLDSSVAGQLFQQSFVGLRATQFGTLTFGRQTTVLAEGIINYDPNHASQAFSLIGASGAAAGGGNTEDRRLDSSLKYVSPESYLLHSRAQLKFGDSSGAAGSAAEINIGAASQDGSVDLYYARVNRAISASSLSAAQLSLLPSLGLSPANSLAAVASDNEAYALMGLYRWDRTTWSAGYERIRYANPVGGVGDRVRGHRRVRPRLHQHSRLSGGQDIAGLLDGRALSLRAPTGGRPGLLWLQSEQLWHGHSQRLPFRCCGDVQWHTQRRVVASRLSMDCSI